MSNIAELEVDPLSSYSYPTPYQNDLGPSQQVCSAIPSQTSPLSLHNDSVHSTATSVHNQPLNYIQPYALSVKFEPPSNGSPAGVEPTVNDVKPAEDLPLSSETPNIKNENDIDSKKGIVSETSKLSIKIKSEELPNTVRRVKKDKKNGEKSNYMSEKINPGFPFYGCSLCNINYPTLQELDVHVTTHKNRFTSYDLRIKNQIRRKKLRKEQKRMRKLGALVKQEPVQDVLEIKPEDGYIGMEPTTDFMSNLNTTETENSQTSNDNSQTSGENGIVANNVTNIDVKSAALEIKRMIESEQHNLNNLQKIYKCFACSKQFTLSYYLKLHVRSHTDEKPYKCKECDQSFITASKLGRHIKRIHLAIKYTCRICYKIFTRFEYLTRHFDKKHIEDKLEGEPYDYNAILPYLKELEEQLQIKSEGEKEEKPKVEGLWSDDWPELTTNAQNILESPKQSENDSKQPEVASSKPESENKAEVILKEPEIVTYEPERPKLDSVPQTNMDETTNNFESHDSNYNSDDDNMDFELDGSNFDEQPFMPGNHLDIVIEEIKVPMDDVKEEEEEVKVKAEKPETVKCEPDVKNEESSDEDYFPINTWASTPKIDHAPPSPRRKKRLKSDGPLKCKECNKTINSASYMKVHMRTHTGEKPFKCYICNRGFITSSKMHRHVLTHNESWDDESKVKKEGDGKDKSDIKEENKDDDKKDNESLKKAKAKFSKNKKKSGEMRKKHQKRPHACEFCQQKFLHLETLNVHKKSHEGEEVKRQCNFCLEEIEDEEKLKEHEATHTGPKPYHCTICGRNYKRRETMIYHRKHHKPEKLFVCDLCSKSFNAQCKLQRHIVSHRVDKFTLRYECPVCAHMFHTKYHIQMHLSTHQKEGLISEENRNDILAMVLQNARKIPKSNDWQPNAPESIPADERSRVCNICGEMFQHFYYLEEHLKSHGSKIAIEDLDKEEEKKYVCQICNKSFKLHYYLKLHTFTHTKEKPYACQQCGKGFITKGKLKRHLETHTGLKKYQCHICYKFFTRPSYLRIHVRTIHGTQDYNFKMLKQYSLPPLNGLSVFGDRSI